MLKLLLLLLIPGIMATQATTGAGSGEPVAEGEPTSEPAAEPAAEPAPAMTAEEVCEKQFGGVMDPTGVTCCAAVCGSSANCGTTVTTCQDDIPTTSPTRPPTDSPTPAPTQAPSRPPTDLPTRTPTPAPPTPKPTNKPSDSPTKAPTDGPSRVPTRKPTSKPTADFTCANIGAVGNSVASANKEACCHVDCGQCGGTDCSKRADGSLTFGQATPPAAGASTSAWCCTGTVIKGSQCTRNLDGTVNQGAPCWIPEDGSDKNVPAPAGGRRLQRRLSTGTADCVLTNPTGGTYDITTVTSGQSATLTPASGYTCTNTAPILCTNAQMADTPTCNADCPLPTITGGSWATGGSSINHGASDTFTAATGYTCTNADIALTCTNGQLSQTPACTAAQPAPQNPSPTTPVVAQPTAATTAPQYPKEKCCTNTINRNARINALAGTCSDTVSAPCKMEMASFTTTLTFDKAITDAQVTINVLATFLGVAPAQISVVDQATAAPFTIKYSVSVPLLKGATDPKSVMKSTIDKIDRGTNVNGELSTALNASPTKAGAGVVLVTAAAMNDFNKATHLPTKQPTDAPTAKPTYSDEEKMAAGIIAVIVIVVLLFLCIVTWCCIVQYRNSSGDDSGTAGAEETPAGSTEMAGSGVPEGWEERQDAEGNTYYNHIATGKTQWTKPKPGDVPTEE